MRMKKVGIYGIAILMFFFIVSLFVGPMVGTALAKTYRLKIQSTWPRGDISMDTLAAFAESAEKRSNGQVKIKVFGAPEIVPDADVLSATKKGVLDMVHGGGIIWGEMIPVAYVEFGLPGAYIVDGSKSFEEGAEEIRNLYFEHGLIDIFRKEYAKQNLHFLDIHVYGPVPVVMSTKNIKSCSDLKGLIVRSEGPNMQYQTAVGMKAVSISGEETYLSLKTGRVDVAEWDISAITGFKWHEVAPYWIRGMESDQALGSMSVNMKKWNSFPDDIKGAISAAAKDYFYATVTNYKKEVDAAYALAKEGKLTIINLDQDCKDKYAAMAKKMMDGDYGDDPATMKAIEIIKKWKGWK